MISRDKFLDIIPHDELTRTKMAIKEFQKDLTFMLQLRSRHTDDPEITQLCTFICKQVKAEIAFLWDFYQFTQEEEVRQDDYKRKLRFTTYELPLTYGTDNNITKKS